MSYTETKTLGVKYIDHRFKLYINGRLFSNDVKLNDGTTIYVETEEALRYIDGVYCRLQDSKRCFKSR